MGLCNATANKTF